MDNRYEEALKKAREWYVDAQIDFKKSLEVLFPELKESGDERIRKELIKIVNDHYSLFKEIDRAKTIAWLEKQGEQKPTEWSEENKKVIDCIEETLYSHLDYVKEDIRCTKRERKETKENFDKCIDWLKSLKPWKQWKPSEEQIIALRWVLNNVPYNKHKEEISGLLDQIKKL